MNIFPKYHYYMHNIMIFFVIAACFSINLPTAWLSIFSGLILITWFLDGRLIKDVKSISNHPALLITVAFFFLYAIDALYSSASWDPLIKFILKYSKLLLIPIIALSTDSDRIRNYGINAFLISAIIVLALSYLEYFNILQNIYFSQEKNIVFKSSITQNIFSAFAMFIMLSKTSFSKNKMNNPLWYFLALLSFLNIFYVVNSRTGQIIAVFLVLLFLFQRVGIKFIPWLFTIITFLFIFKHQLEPLIPQKLLNTTNEISAHHANSTQTSAGIRLEVYKNTFALIQKSPLLGYGSGSFGEEYHNFIKDKDTLLVNITNPHNQFLLTTFELGLLGLFLMLLMFYSHWISSNDFNDNYQKNILKALVLSFLIGSLFNSLLLDAGEGKFYCLLGGLLLSAYSGGKKSLTNFFFK